MTRSSHDADSDGGFRTFPHTADVGLDVWGRSFEALFSWAALGLMSLGAGHHPDERRVACHRPDDAPGRVRPRVKVELEAGDPEALLVEWLSRLLVLLEVDGLVVAGCSLAIVHPSLEVQSWTLSGTAEVESLPPGHRRTVVKAVTYHGLKIAQAGDGIYRARILLDV